MYSFAWILSLYCTGFTYHFKKSFNCLIFTNISFISIFISSSALCLMKFVIRVQFVWNFLSPYKLQVFHWSLLLVKFYPVQHVLYIQKKRDNLFGFCLDNFFIKQINSYRNPIFFSIKKPLLKKINQRAILPLNQRMSSRVFAAQF